MVRITASKELLARLGDLKEPAELCDSSGNCVATVIPSPSQLREDYATAQAEFSDEEIDRARTEADGCTTHELLDGFTQ